MDSYRVPYFVDAGTAVLALLLVILYVKESEVKDPPNPEVQRTVRSSSIKLPMSFPFKILLVCSFVNGMGMGFIMPIMVLFYNDKFGIEPVEIGLIFTVSGFIGLLASYYAGRFSDRAGRMPIIALGSYLSNGCNFVLPLTADVTQAAAVLSVRGLAFNINMPAMRALRADITPAEARGRYFGLFTTAWTAGDIISPIVGAYLYDLYRFVSFDVGGFPVPGYSICFFVNSLLGVFSTTLLLVLVKEPRTHAGDAGLEPLGDLE